MMLVNGVLCIIVSVILLIQIARTQESEGNQMLYKFAWIYWATLVLIGINHIASGIVAPWLTGIINSIGPLTDILNVIAGLMLSIYLSKRRQAKQAYDKTKVEDPIRVH